MTIMTMMIIYKLIKVVHMGFIVVMTPTLRLQEKIQFVREKIGKDQDYTQIKDL